jgi:hypothetical protein
MSTGISAARSEVFSDVRVETSPLDRPRPMADTLSRGRAGPLHRVSVN